MNSLRIGVAIGFLQYWKLLVDQNQDSEGEKRNGLFTAI